MTGGAPAPGSEVTLAAVDEGLRSYMLGVYNYMAAGVALTGVAAYLTFMFAVQNGALTPFGQAIYTSPLRWVVMLAPLGFVFRRRAALHEGEIDLAVDQALEVHGRALPGRARAALLRPHPVRQPGDRAHGHARGGDGHLHAAAVRRRISSTCPSLAG